MSTYDRLNLHVTASPRDVIRATRSRILKGARRNRKWRQQRHKLYRIMLTHHVEVQKLYYAVMSGDLYSTLSDDEIVKRVGRRGPRGAG